MLRHPIQPQLTLALSGCRPPRIDMAMMCPGSPLERPVMCCSNEPTVAALYVETDGAYSAQPGVDPWDEQRDARLYAGPHPVVAHPPCQRWGKMWFGQPLTVKLTGKRKKKCDDGGCFAAALASVRKWGACSNTRGARMRGPTSGSTSRPAPAVGLRRIFLAAGRVASSRADTVTTQESRRCSTPSALSCRRWNGARARHGLTRQLLPAWV
jgi:hypothetical protein